MDSNGCEILKRMRNIEYLQKLLDKCYIVNSKWTDPSRNLGIFKRFLNKGYEFIPEIWLKNRGYVFVEPCNFTKGYKLAYKIEDGVLEQYYESNYSLIKNDDVIQLYLLYKQYTKYEIPSIISPIMEMPSKIRLIIETPHNTGKKMFR